MTSNYIQDHNVTWKRLGAGGKNEKELRTKMSARLGYNASYELMGFLYDF